MNQEKIGLYIQSKRKELNLTQKEFSEKLGVSDKTVSKWERGINLPDVSLYDDVCKILNISLVEFLKGEDVEDDKKINEAEKELKKSLAEKNRTVKFIKLLSFLIILLGTFFLFFSGAFDEAIPEFFSLRPLFGFLVMILGFVIYLFQKNVNLIRKCIYLAIYILLIIAACICSVYLYFAVSSNIMSVWPGVGDKYTIYNIYALKKEYIGMSPKDIIDKANDTFIYDKCRVVDYEDNYNNIYYNVFYKNGNFNGISGFNFSSPDNIAFEDKCYNKDESDDMWSVLGDYIAKNAIYRVTYKESYGGYFEHVLVLKDSNNNYVFFSYGYNTKFKRVYDDNLSSEEIIRIAVSLFHAPFNNEYYVIDNKSNDNFHFIDGKII